MTGTERKVFQKYYPPDFDPSKIPRAKGQRNRQFIQRVMAPYNMQCNTCNEYIYKGKKFNMRRETAEGEFYLGLKIFRFYFRCPNCLAEITFKTDLENCDYQQEHGATRLFEAFKLYQEQEKAKETQDDEDKNDPMKMLEKRTKLSRAEMEALGKLEELQEFSRRQENFDTGEYIANHHESQAAELKKQENEDDDFVKRLFHRTEDGKIIKRLIENDDEVDYGMKARVLRPTIAKESVESAQKKLLSKIVVLKKKKKDEMEADGNEDDVSQESRNLVTVKLDSLKSERSSSTSKDNALLASNSADHKFNALSSLAAYGSDSCSD